MNNEIKEKIPFNVRDVLEDINSNILWNYITNLQQENERLKEDYSKAMNLVDKGVENSYKMVKDYKSRCEKAIESLKLKQIRYVNESDYVIDDGDLQEEINILQNGSDE